MSPEHFFSVMSKLYVIVTLTVFVETTLSGSNEGEPFEKLTQKFGVSRLIQETGINFHAIDDMETKRPGVDFLSTVW